MINILTEKTQGKTIALKAEGKIEKSDYDRIVPIMEELVKKHEKLDAYVEVRELDKVTARALWEEIKVDVRFFNNINKVAVVGDATWKEVLTKAVAILPNIEAKYFDLDEKEKAQFWIGLI
ncbi:hypothetical protein BH23BAC1_BH23BAC1_39510 [soil metagenome]